MGKNGIGQCFKPNRFVIFKRTHSFSFMFFNFVSAFGLWVKSM